MIGPLLCCSRADSNSDLVIMDEAPRRGYLSAIPKSTEGNSREDMTIVIFTIAQWPEHLVVSATPFDPVELGHNRKYVLAVPHRWDYDFAEGEASGKNFNS